jgi:L-fuculose-phosphate aldolase
MAYKDYREQLYQYIQQGCQDGLIRLSAGNFSIRIDENLIAITPSGILYRSMTADDISIIDISGKLIEGRPPSSETPMHTAIYEHIPRAKAICHTHSVYAMVFAQLEEDIPLISIELMVCGAPIPVAPWATPGTMEAGIAAVETFQARNELKVMLLRKHGLVAIGENLNEAYQMAANAETGMEIYHKAKQLGEVQPFSEDQIKEIQEVYGL